MSTVSRTLHGVFNPYSGVKTSILFFDRQIAKKTDEILFVKIEADGYGLGAQRKPVDSNDLPEAYQALTHFKNNLQLPAGDSQAKANGTREIAHTAAKKDIAAQDYNLSAARYVQDVIKHGKWPRVKLGEVCSFEYGKSLPEKNRRKGDVPVLGSNGRTGFHNEYIVRGPTIIIGRKGSSGEVVWESENCFPIDTTYYIKYDAKKINLKYLYQVLRVSNLKELSGGAGIPGLNRNDAYKKIIPLPPLSVQQEIVSEIESCQKIIDGAKQIIANWKPKIDINPEWPMVKLGEVVEINPEAGEPIQLFNDNPFVYIDISSVENNTGNVSFDNILFPKEAPSRARRIVRLNDVLLSTVRPNLKAFAFLKHLPERVLASTGFAVLRAKHSIMPYYIYLITVSDFVVEQLIDCMGKGAYPSVNTNDLKIIKIPLPPLSIQQEIVSRIEEEQSHLKSCQKLIEIYQSKIKSRITKLWEE